MLGTLPIWCGPTSINGLNHKAFINYQDYNQMKDFVNKISSVDQSDEQFFNMYEQPLF